MTDTEKAEVFKPPMLLFLQKMFNMLSAISLSKRGEVQARVGIKKGI